MTDFDHEVLERKRLARMAQHRKCGSRSRKCSLSTDHMTPRQWKERNGEMHTYNLNRPMNWEAFLEMPADLQGEYLRRLVEDFQVNATNLGQLFHVHPATVRRYLSEANLPGVSLADGYRKNAAQVARWDQFLRDEPEPGSVSAATVSDPEPGREASPEPSGSPPSGSPRLAGFTLTFRGRLDPEAIANSILSLVGRGAEGTVTISCTLSEPGER